MHYTEQSNVTEHPPQHYIARATRTVKATVSGWEREVRACPWTPWSSITGDRRRIPCTDTSQLHFFSDGTIDRNSQHTKHTMHVSLRYKRLVQAESTVHRIVLYCVRAHIPSCTVQGTCGRRVSSVSPRTLCRQPFTARPLRSNVERNLRARY